MSGDSRSRQIRRELREAGWVVRPTRGGHWRADHPDASGPMFLAATPSDGRTIHHVRAQARRLLRRSR